MLSMLNFLGLKTEFVMLYMQNFLGFHAECFGCLDQRKLSFVYPFMHDQHEECSRFLD